jgi:hypothetical protein
MSSRLSRPFLMFHAGRSVTGLCRSLVFVAPGGTGKTTLAIALGQDYGTYGRDSRDGRERTDPPVPEAALPPTSATRIKREASPDELSLGPAHPAPNLGRLVLLRRSPASWANRRSRNWNARRGERPARGDVGTEQVPGTPAGSGRSHRAHRAGPAPHLLGRRQHPAARG